MVSIGAGAALAGLTSNYPELIWLSRYKTWIFGFSAIMLALAGWLQWRARYLPCPADPVQAKACIRLRRFSLGIYCFAVLIYIIGAFFAFAAVHVLF